MLVGFTKAFLRFLLNWVPRWKMIVAVLAVLYGFGLLKSFDYLGGIDHSALNDEVPSPPAIALAKMNDFTMQCNKHGSLCYRISSLTSDQGLSDIRDHISSITWLPEHDDWIAAVSAFYKRQWREDILDQTMELRSTGTISNMNRYIRDGISSINVVDAELRRRIDKVSNQALKSSLHLDDLEATVQAHRNVESATSALVHILDKSDKVCEGRSNARTCDNFEKWHEDLRQDLETNEILLERMKIIHDQLVDGNSYVRTVNAPYLLWTSWPVPTNLSPGVLKQLAYGYVQLDVHLQNCMGKYYGWTLVAIEIAAGTFGALLIGVSALTIYPAVRSHLRRQWAGAEKDPLRYYDRLRILDRPASIEQIESQFETVRQEIKGHPGSLKLLEEAHKVLSDPEQRAKYDTRFGYDQPKVGTYRAYNDTNLHYEVLGLDSKSSDQQIDQAWKDVKELMGNATSIWKQDCYNAYRSLKHRPAKEFYDEVYGYQISPTYYENFMAMILTPFSWFWSNKTPEKAEPSPAPGPSPAQRHVSVTENAGHDQENISPRTDGPRSSDNNARRRSSQTSNPGSRRNSSRATLGPGSPLRQPPSNRSSARSRRPTLRRPPNGPGCSSNGFFPFYPGDSITSGSRGQGTDAPSSPNTTWKTPPQQFSQESPHAGSTRGNATQAQVQGLGLTFGHGVRSPRTGTPNLETLQQAAGLSSSQTTARQDMDGPGGEGSRRRREMGQDERRVSFATPNY